MTTFEHAPGYVPNPDYTQEDWDDVHSPDATDEQLTQMRPAAEIMPEFVEALSKHRGPQKKPTKTLLSLRVDRDVIEAYRISGPGWQGRMNDALRKSVGL